jgi:hypothetical protein
MGWVLDIMVEPMGLKAQPMGTYCKTDVTVLLCRAVEITYRVTDHVTRSP